MHIKDSDRDRRPGENEDIAGDIHFTPRAEIESKDNCARYAAIYYRYGNVYGICADQLIRAFTKKEMHFIIMSDIGAIRKLKEVYDGKAIHVHIDPAGCPIICRNERA